MVRRSFLLIGGVLLSILLSAPAMASGPTMQKLSDEVILDDLLCPDGFTYDLVLVGKGTAKDFGDRYTESWTYQGTAVSGGISVRIHHSFNVEFDWGAGTATITGLAFGARVEGTSVSRMDRGRLVFDLGSGEAIFVAGKWLPFEGGHLATCDVISAALA